MKSLNDLKERKLAKQGRPTRKSKQAMYNCHRWKSYAKRYKQDNPLCVECAKHDRVSPAYCVDHIRAHGGNERMFWEPSNHQSLCMQCHNRKSRFEKG